MAPSLEVQQTCHHHKAGRSAADRWHLSGTLALTSFRSSFNINAGNSSYLSVNIVSVYQAGAFFGSLFAIPVADRYGRKVCILAAGVLFNVGRVQRGKLDVYGTVTN
jgi:MFS family permease